MEGAIATLLAVGVIATLMVIGIRTELPPPDPDWREHLPPPPPPPPRWWQYVWFGRFALMPIGFLTILAGWRLLGGALLSLYVLLTIGLSFDAIRRSLRHRRALREREEPDREAPGPVR